MRDDRAYFRHILDAIDKIADYIRIGETEFLEDTLVQDAVIRNLEVIGEAVKYLSPEIKARNPAVPWNKIAGMRDKLIHQYFGVKLDVVWHTASGVVPAFRDQLMSIMPGE